MAKYQRNAGKHWTGREVRQLRVLARQNTPTRVIGLKLGRPVGGVYAKAAQSRISLAPPNRSSRSRTRP
jgi:hypothetical protein